MTASHRSAAPAVHAGLPCSIHDSLRSTRPARVGLAGLALLSTLLWGSLTTLADEPGPPYGNDDNTAACWNANTCDSQLSTPRICGFSSLPPYPNSYDNGPLLVNPSGTLAQGQSFWTQFKWCNLVRWRVDVTTRTPAGNQIRRAYEGTSKPVYVQIPECQPLGDAWVTQGGWGPFDAGPDWTHWRNSEILTITPGSQACVYSADVNPRPVLQGEGQVVFWSAPNNQARARAYLLYPGGTQST